MFDDDGGGGDGDGGANASLGCYVAQHIRALSHALCAQALARRSQGGDGGASGSKGHGKGGSCESASAIEARENRLARELSARKIILCNKSDLFPCPMPQLVELDVGAVFLAGSAAKGTNMAALWRLIHVYAAPPAVPHRPWLFGTWFSWSDAMRPTSSAQ